MRHESDNHQEAVEHTNLELTSEVWSQDQDLGDRYTLAAMSMRRLTCKSWIKFLYKKKRKKPLNNTDLTMIIFTYFSHSGSEPFIPGLG